MTFAKHPVTITEIKEVVVGKTPTKQSTVLIDNKRMVVGRYPAYQTLQINKQYGLNAQALYFILSKKQDPIIPQNSRVVTNINGLEIKGKALFTEPFEESEIGFTFETTFMSDNQ
jgi:hypothetical protein